MKFTKLTKNNIQRLAPGESINENGLVYRKGKNGGSFYLNIRQDGERIRNLIGNDWEGFTIDDAISMLLRTKLGDIKTVKTTFGELLDIYYQDQKKNGKNFIGKECHMRKYFYPRLGQLPVAQITSKTVQEYINRRLSEAAKPATINRELSTLSHIFSQLALLGHDIKKPIIKKLPEANVKTRYLSTSEVADLLQAARNDSSMVVYLFIVLGIYTGMRRSEILNIKVEHIDFEAGTILIPKAKAGGRYQPIPMIVSEALKEYITQRQISLFLFWSSRAGSRIRCIKSAFRRCCRKAGLGPDVTIHTLRHTAISHLVQSGIDLVTIKSISGHKTVQMLERYAHHSRHEVDRAFNYLTTKLPKVAKSHRETHENPA